MKKLIFACLIFTLFAVCSWGVNYDDGIIRLELRENNGRFLLYCVSENSGARYIPFFNDQDPRTSFLQISVDGRSYKLGDTSTFRSQLKKDLDIPGIVFTSSFLRVTHDFTFIKTAGSPVSNGVAMRITMQNLSDRSASIGFRFILDTYLGEKTVSHFVTDTRSISAEALIDRRNADKFWISRGESSRGESLSLMGSIFLPGGESPDSVQFANWQRLNEVSWKLQNVPGRSFNAPPYSVRDSAVCYYFEPRTMNSGAAVSFVILLAKEDGMGFLPFVPLDTSSGRQSDLELIQSLIDQIDRLSAQTNHDDDEVAELERKLNELLIKYGLPPHR